jgi:hypothetical protein
MNKTMHGSGLVTILGLQLATIFADTKTPWQARVASAMAAILLLVFSDPTTQRKAITIALGVAGIVVPLVGFALTKMPAGTMLATVASSVLAVFVRLPAMLPVPPAPPAPTETDSPAPSKPAA